MTHLLFMLLRSFGVFVNVPFSGNIVICKYVSAVMWSRQIKLYYFC